MPDQSNSHNPTMPAGHNPTMPAGKKPETDLFRLLVDRVLDYAIFQLTPDGHVASWNAGAQRLKGYTPLEIIGHSFERFYTPEDRAAGHPAELLAAARRDGRVEDEGWRVRKDGSLFWADVVITALVDEGGQHIGFAKVTRDLTERRQAEQERATLLAVERAAERVSRLQVATAALAAANGREEIAEALTDAGMTALGAVAGVVAYPNAAADVLEVMYASGYTAESMAQHRVFGPDAPYPFTYAWRTCQAVFLRSRAHVQADYAELEPLLTASPHEGWAAVPLIVDRRVVGVLGLSFDAPQAFDNEQRGVLLALGEVAAQAVDRAAMYDSETRARAEAEAAVRTQDEFLSIASHELRTPVAAVKATAQLAQRAIQRGTYDTERAARHLTSIARAADRLGDLIEDLLDVSRLRTGQLQLRTQTLDLTLLAREVVERYRTTELAHRFSLSVPDTQAPVFADALRIEQVLDNFLSNAVKYSPDGGDIDVRVCVQPDGVLLSVQDHGIGLPSGQETRIFEVFGRASNAAAQQIQGLGLGLAICRQLIEAHGGRIWAHSPGEHLGTTVSVWLPTTHNAQTAPTCD